MLDIEGIVLHKIISDKDLDNFSKLRSNFFSRLYQPLFRLLNSYYLKFGDVPSFDNLIVANRDPNVLESIHALQLLNTPDVPTDHAVSALIDKYMQDATLDGIAKILNRITTSDTSEIKQQIGNLMLELDSKLNTDENVIYANQVSIFEEEQISEAKKVPTGISNWIDANVGGFFEEDLVLIGGYRGSGKSVVCANVVVNQYLQGNVGVYFTIEMTGQETFGRIMSILSQVRYSKIKLNKLHPEDDLALVKVRADMFENASNLIDEYIDHKDKFKFERELINTKHLKRNNQVIIVDDRELTIPTIDFTIQKLKAVHGDNLRVVVVDYVNQVSLGSSSSDMYDWKDQLTVSKQLKNIARKHRVTMVSPYQIDESGAARLSKGILDACDLALILHQEEDGMVFSCSKSRASKSTFKCKVGFNADTLTIDPAEIPLEAPKEKEEKKKSNKFTKAKLGDDDI
jgi:KaiC/GvpD/RAD55 family RecA-like ATPase